MHWYHEQRCFKDSQLPLEQHKPKVRPLKEVNTQRATKWMRSEGRYAADGSMAIKRPPPKPWPPPPVSLNKLNNKTGPNRVLPFEQFTALVADDKEGLAGPKDMKEAVKKAQAPRKNPLDAKLKRLVQSQHVLKPTNAIADKQMFGLLRGMTRASQTKVANTTYRPEWTKEKDRKTPVQLICEEMKCEKRHVENILSDFSPQFFTEDGRGEVAFSSPDARPLLRRAFGQEMTEPEFLETWASMDPEKAGLTFQRLLQWLVTQGTAPREASGKKKEEAPPARPAKAKPAVQVGKIPGHEVLGRRRK